MNEVCDFSTYLFDEIVFENKYCIVYLTSNQWMAYAKKDISGNINPIISITFFVDPFTSKEHVHDILLYDYTTKKQTIMAIHGFLKFCEREYNIEDEELIHCMELCEKSIGTVYA